ncbi:MAG: co-chaperone GroES family protein [Melioribacteraceae bacterium]|nr:co-chaperone GroES family protein [Melioribacteraceae bacterium]MCF8354426.1 co-chaperone GroES family protein [Melioribacteraceae bacterium]MCF8394036.1 co-chaperone GroES family protein [Melioribacteraceae bacterium]MCF8419802.1 co-chaperone GroES family protein [Melioribacteraceae bacterium]
MVDTAKIIVVGDKVLIRPQDEDEKSRGGLYLPPGVKEKEKVHGGYILKVGPGFPIANPVEDEPWKEKKETKYIPLQVKAGDYAVFMRRDAIEIEFDNEKLVIVPQSAILMVVRDDELTN